jgi:uncharacterized membrane protein
VFSKTGTEAYAPLSGKDFRMSAAEVNKLFGEVKKEVEADRPDLSKAANEARQKNAQVFAAGNEPGWSLVINPSKNEIVFTGNYGAETKTFAYNNPEQGPVGESIYEVRLGEERLKATIASKYCVDDSGKVFPYTVVVQWQGKSLSGCGIILQ